MEKRLGSRNLSLNLNTSTLLLYDSVDLLPHQDYVPGGLMLSFSHWHQGLSASMSALASASELAQCLSFQKCA